MVHQIGPFCQSGQQTRKAVNMEMLNVHKLKETAQKPGHV